ncbi:MAG TPA: heme o synthase [Candidatus Omnitrophota bacterium]|nr:heme o synthase [Candidatus Omnitrophota bacterium]
MKNKFPVSAYFELTKPRILALVLVTTTIGFFLGGKGISSFSQLLVTLTGAGLVCAGAAALNQYLERDADSKMQRTKNRPIPLKVIAPNSAMLFGIVLILLGVLVLTVCVNLLTAFLSLLTAFLYVLVYTPFKKISWLNTTIGAIPGAIPPMGGWAAASGALDLGAWILFLILFIWQHPHFYAIAWMFKEDYKKGGFKMLSGLDTDGKKMFAQIKFFAILMIPVSLLPTMIGMSGQIYFYGALLSSIGLFWAARTFLDSKTFVDAQKLLRATVMYLPVLLFLIIFDVTF